MKIMLFQNCNDFFSFVLDLFKMAAIKNCMILN